MALRDEVELDELVQGDPASVTDRPFSSRLLQILGLGFLLLAGVCLLSWSMAGDSSAASNQNEASPAVSWTLSPTWTLAPTGATTTMAPTVRESCACSAGYPYCWPDDQHCYRSASSGEWSDTLCAGSCTSSLAGCGATPPVEPGSTWQFTQTFAGGYQPNLIVSWLCTVSVTVCQQLDLSC